MIEDNINSPSSAPSTQVEESLRASEEYFRTIFEQAMDGILVSDAQGRFLDCNSEACKQLGYARGELLSMSVESIVLPDDLERLAQEMMRLTGVGGEIIRSEWQVRRKDGSVFLCEVTSKQLPNGRLQAFLRDVTEMRHTQTQLQERQHFLQQVLDTEPGTVYIFDLATSSNVYVNRHWLTAYGYSPEETAMMGNELLGRIFSPDDLARVEAHHVAWRQASEGEIRDIEYHVQTKSGEWRWLHSRETVFARDAAGQVTQILGIANDITDRKAAEMALRESERKLWLVMDGLGPSMFVGLMTPDGVVRVANRPALAAAGLTPEDVVGKPVEETYWFSYSASVQAQLRAAVARAQRGESARYDVPIRVADGVTIWIDLSFTPVLDAQGQVSFIVPSASVIDERKKLEIKLAASEALLRTIVDSEPACVKLLDVSGKLLEINAAGLTMIEADSREMIIGKDMAQLVVPEHREAFIDLQRRVISGSSGTLEFDVIGLKGTCRTLETHAVPLYDAQGKVTAALGLTSDITERKRTELTNLRLERQLQQAQKMEAVGQLTAGIAHDFNNILASVLGYAGLALEQHVPDKSSKLADYLREVQTAGTRARDLIVNMLAFSRSGETRRQPVQIGPLAQEAAKTLAPMLPSSIAFTTRVAEDGMSVLADPVQLHQVIMNLVINARDAVGEHGRIELAVHLVRGVKATCGGCHGDVIGDFIELAISDNGPGIPANVLPHIFDPFYTTKAVGKGTGMGLSVVHGVVHLCGGHVLVNSSANTGTVVRVLLPIVNIASAFLATLPNAVDRIRAGSGHILVVDDEDVLAELFGEVLKAHGYDVTVFNDSLLALEQFHSTPMQFDAVISDQTMPGLTGVELAQALRALRPALPIMLCTGYSSALDREVAEHLDVALLSKPVAFETLLLTLQQMLAAARAKNVTT